MTSQFRVFLTAPNAECISIMQHRRQGAITPGMILLSVNVKSDYALSSTEGGGGPEREGGIERERGWLEERFREKEGLR